MKRPLTYRKKPVEIEAIQFTGKNANAIAHFVGEASTIRPGPSQIDIRTLEGTMTASKNDWIIKGVQGEFYPCKPDIFAATYEPATPELHDYPRTGSVSDAEVDALSEVADA